VTVKFDNGSSVCVLTCCLLSVVLTSHLLLFGAFMNMPASADTLHSRNFAAFNVFMKHFLTILYTDTA